MSLNVITREAGRISAYADSALIYQGKGDDTQGKPYGIIDDGTDDPFGLTFDTSALTVTIGKGMAHIYGRQVEITESEQVYDFHSTASSTTIYCNIYLEISLVDLTAQTAKIVLVMNGGGYDDSSEQETANLYQRDNGVYRAPINHFIYYPATGTFGGYGFDMETLDNESRYATRNLRADDSINGVKVSELTETFDNNGTTGLRFLNADNSEALSYYSSLTSPSSSSSGYSVADETEAIGIGDDAVAIDEDELSGLLTVDRIHLMTINKNFGKTTAGIYGKMKNYDWDRLQAVRVWFALGSGVKVQLTYQARTILSVGIPSTHGAYPSENFMAKDYWPTIRNNRVLMELVGTYRTSGMDSYEVELSLRDTTDESTPTGYDGYLDTFGIATASYQLTSHRFGLLKIEGDWLTFQFYGDTGTLNEHLAFIDHAWWEYFGLEPESAQGDMYVDMIYKGGVDLS